MSQPAPDSQHESDSADQSVESFRFDAATARIVRRVRLRDGRMIDSSVPCAHPDPADLGRAFDHAWLRTKTRPALTSPLRGTKRIVDLFSGCGAMTMGATEAFRALGYATEHVLAVDINPHALGVYSKNFPDARISSASITEVLNSAFGEPPSSSEEELRRHVGPIDLLLAGPPCQGHSDLNNHTRRMDPKNDLYFTVARFAELVRPRCIVVENVPGARHDRGKVVQRTRDALVELGYEVDTGVVHAAPLGVPQTRKRFFLLASLDRTPCMNDIQSHRVRQQTTLDWAISDLMGTRPSTTNPTFDTPARASTRNQERIAYLHAHPESHDLPNEERPPCHKDKPHSYNSVYGRMYWDRPAQTITTGFGSCGQGRYVHSHEPRTLTPHEAARVQFIPDFFTFPEKGRRALQRMIGNAVPPKMAYAVCLELFR